MRIGLIGDIHANLHALIAVLAHAEGQNVELFWNVGDLVGYGAFPDEVVRHVRDAGVHSIAGNYDLKVLRFPKKRDKWRRTKQPEKWLAFQWAYKRLSKESRAYLKSLPFELRLQAAGRRILVTHGSPASNKEPLTPATPEERMLALAQMAEADLVICGHSHHPLARTASGVWFVNPGSVGRPGDGDPRASYAVLELEPGRSRVQHHRVAYDVAAAVAAIRSHQLPEIFAQMLLLGRDFDTAEDQQVRSSAGPYRRQDEHGKG